MIERKIQRAHGLALNVEFAVGHTQAYFDNWPDTYEIAGREYDALGLTYASSNRDPDKWEAYCTDCDWSLPFTELPRDPCLMYVVPVFCPVCLEEGGYSTVRHQKFRGKTSVFINR